MTAFVVDAFSQFDRLEDRLIDLGVWDDVVLAKSEGGLVSLVSVLSLIDDSLKQGDPDIFSARLFFMGALFHDVFLGRLVGDARGLLLSLMELVTPRVNPLVDIIGKYVKDYEGLENLFRLVPGYEGLLVKRSGLVHEGALSYLRGCGVLPVDNPLVVSDYVESALCVLGDVRQSSEDLAIYGRQLVLKLHGEDKFVFCEVILQASSGYGLKSVVRLCYVLDSFFDFLPKQILFIDSVIMALYRLPDAEDRLKVLNVFPIRFVTMIAKRCLDYRELVQRDLSYTFMKVWQDVMRYGRDSRFPHVVVALEELDI